MSAPRLSIIPAGAVFDRLLEPRDLQVLCLLGVHTDKLGWCFKSQVVMATELHCGRSSIQRSLDRLYEAGWVERHHRSHGKIVDDLDHPHAAHAYRVKLDRTDVPFAVLSDGSKSEAPDGGCPPVGTRDPSVGSHGPPVGRGCPRMHGHMNDDSNVSESESRAREASPMAQAFAVTKQIATIAGILDDMAWPLGWTDAPTRIDQFLRAGYTPDMLLMGAREAMASRKDKEPPWSVEYFARPFSKVRARRAKPLPVVEIQQAERVILHEQARPSGIVAAGERKIAQLERNLADIRATRASDGKGAVRLPARDADV